VSLPLVFCRFLDVPRLKSPLLLLLLLLPTRDLLGILLPLLPGPVLGRTASNSVDSLGLGDSARDNKAEALDNVTETARLAGLYTEASTAALYRS
jgi:hypothetical protein